VRNEKTKIVIVRIVCFLETRACFELHASDLDILSAKKGQVPFLGVE